MRPPFAAIEPPLRVREFVVLETVPAHCETGGALAISRPLGKASVKFTPVRAMLFGLLIVMLKPTVPSAATVLLENDLLTLGGAITGIVTFAGLEVRSLLSVTVNWKLASPLKLGFGSNFRFAASAGVRT